MNIRFKVKTELDSEVLRQMAKNVLWKSVIKIHELSTKIAPVDTGRLRGSLHVSPWSPGSLKYLIGDGVHYGVHIEYGTYKSGAQPFLRPAADEVSVVWAPQYWERELSK